jgi:hypothetical protein
VDLAGSGYLYTLATVSVTFVGFSALLIVFRQAMGGELTRYDTNFALAFIRVGFIVTAGALLPPLLALCGWSESTTWRVSSAAVGIPTLWFVASIPRRRRTPTSRSVPTLVWIMLAVDVIAAVALLLCAAGAPWRGATIFVLSLSAILFASGIAYLVALSVILPDVTQRK